MQFFSFCLFTIICGYSLVISAPVKQTAPDTQETKQQKATAIASRLLKELAGEQLAANHQEQSSNKDESKDAIIPINRPVIEKVESHVGKQNDDLIDDDEDLDLIPTMDDLYEIYDDQYIPLADDGEFSSEINDDEYILPISKQQLIRYLIEQEQNNKDLTPVIHTPIIDDSIMTAENHRRRRRSIY